MKLNEYYNIALGSDSLIEEYELKEEYCLELRGYKVGDLVNYSWKDNTRHGMILDIWPEEVNHNFTFGIWQLDSWGTVDIPLKDITDRITVDQLTEKEKENYNKSAKGFAEKRTAELSAKNEGMNEDLDETLKESQYCIYDKNKRACQLYDTYEDAEEALSYCDPEDGCYIKEVSDSEADYIENDITDYDDELNEDTVKQGKKWVNKGEEGTHGKFKTKKEADAQRKAMFANGYKGESLEEAKADLTKGYKYFINGKEITADEYENYLLDDAIDNGQPKSAARRVAKENREDACENGSNTWIILDGSELTILCESLNESWESNMAKADKLLKKLIVETNNENYYDGDSYWSGDDEWCKRYLYQVLKFNNKEKLEQLINEYSKEIPGVTFYSVDPDFDDLDGDEIDWNNGVPGEIGYTIIEDKAKESSTEDMEGKEDIIQKLYDLVPEKLKKELELEIANDFADGSYAEYGYGIYGDFMFNCETESDIKYAKELCDILINNLDGNKYAYQIWSVQVGTITAETLEDFFRQFKEAGYRHDDVKGWVDKYGNEVFSEFCDDNDMFLTLTIYDIDDKVLSYAFRGKLKEAKKESLNEGMFDRAFYNTQEIIDNTTGKNKAFISRIAKHQEEKYGNVDIFDASLKYGEVRIGFGDYSLTFFFDNKGNIKDVTGNGQGKYQASLGDVAKELYKKFGIENGFLGEE